jgi:hypothetical protein
MIGSNKINDDIVFAKMFEQHGFKRVAIEADGN